MKKKLLWLCIGISIFFCTGCFELHEDVQLKKDGSGNYAFYTDLGQFKDFFGALGSESKNKNEKEKDSMSKDKFAADFEKLNDYLKKIDGISDAKVIADTSAFRFGITFNFKNIEALNKALNQIYNKDEDDENEKTAAPVKDEVFFELRDNSFIRYETNSISELLKDKGLGNDMAKDSKDNPFGGMEALFQTVSFSCNYAFDREIKSVSNESSMISSNFKKVSVTCHPFVKETKNSPACSLTNIITFR